MKDNRGVILMLIECFSVLIVVVVHQGIQTCDKIS